MAVGCNSTNSSSSKGDTGQASIQKSVRQLTPPKRSLGDIDESERRATSLTKFIRGSLLDALAERKYKTVFKTLDSEFVGRWPTLDTFEKVETGTITISHLGDAGAWQNRREFSRAMNLFFASSAMMERRSFKIYEIIIDEDAPLNAYVKAHLQLGGKEQEGRRYQLEADVVLTARGKDGVWVVTAWDFNRAIWSSVRTPFFKNVSTMTGVQYEDSRQTRKLTNELVDLRRLFSSGGVTVFDENGDGALDILTTRKGRGARIFTNDGKAGFQKKKIYRTHNDEDATNFYLAVDIDRDGDTDLVSTHVNYLDGQAASLTVYLKTDGKFVPNDKLLLFENDKQRREIDFPAIVTCDLNDDQRLDFLVLGYLNSESGGTQFNLINGQDGQKNLLFISESDGTYLERARQWGMEESQYSYVAECYDFDSDGDSDVLVGNDYGQNNFYQNENGRRFTKLANHPFAKSRGFTMGISMADPNNTGQFSVSLSNMYSHAGNRIVPQVSQLGSEMKSSVLALAGGNNLFERRGESWVDIAQRRGINYAEWAWGNIFFDVDNDGDKDQFVVNGFTTHSDPTAPDF